MYPSTTSSNYFISLITISSDFSTFSSASYNMENKIDGGVGLEKAYPYKDSHFAYMIGEF